MIIRKEKNLMMNELGTPPSLHYYIFLKNDLGRTTLKILTKPNIYFIWFSKTLMFNGLWL